MPGVILIMKLMVIVKLENIQPPWFICVTKCSFIGRYIEKINIKFFQKAQKIAYGSINICIIYFELYFWYWSWFSIRHFKTFTLYEWLSLLLSYILAWYLCFDSSMTFYIPAYVTKYVVLRWIWPDVPPLSHLLLTLCCWSVREQEHDNDESDLL